MLHLMICLKQTWIIGQKRDVLVTIDCSVYYTTGPAIQLVKLVNAVQLYTIIIHKYLVIELVVFLLFAIPCTVAKQVIVVTAKRSWSGFIDDFGELIPNTVEVIFDVEKVQKSSSNACDDQQYEVDDGKDVATKSCPTTRPGTLIVSNIVVTLCL